MNNYTNSVAGQLSVTAACVNLTYKNVLALAHQFHMISCKPHYCIITHNITIISSTTYSIGVCLKPYHNRLMDFLRVSLSVKPSCLHIVEEVAVVYSQFACTLSFNSHEICKHVTVYDSIPSPL